MKKTGRFWQFLRYIFGADLMDLLMEENLRGNSAPLSAYLRCTSAAAMSHR